MLSEVIANAKNYERNLIRQGKTEAEKKAYEEKLEIARKLIKRGLDVNDIAEDTGLRITVIEKEIEKLNKT